MVRLAEQLTAHNNLTASIRICQKRSDELIIQQGNSRVSASRAVRDPASSASDAQQHVHAVQQNGRPRSGITSAAAKRKKYAEQQAMTTTAAESSDMPCKADVIVTEIFDSELLGEGILPTMRHAAKHLLQVWHRPTQHHHLASLLTLQNPAETPSSSQCCCKHFHRSSHIPLDLVHAHIIL